MPAKPQRPLLHFNDRAYTPKQAGQRLLQYVSRDLYDFIEASRMVRCAIIRRDAGKWSEQDMSDFLNAQDRDGWTALTFGVVKKQRGFVGTMIEAGADCLVRDGYGTSLECYASSSKDEKIREWIGAAMEKQARDLKRKKAEEKSRAGAEQKEKMAAWCAKGCPVPQQIKVQPMPAISKKPFPFPPKKDA